MAREVDLGSIMGPAGPQGKQDLPDRLAHLEKKGKKVIRGNRVKEDQRENRGQKEIKAIPLRLQRPSRLLQL